MLRIALIKKLIALMTSLVMVLSAQAPRFGSVLGSAEGTRTIRGEKFIKTEEINPQPDGFHGIARVFTSPVHFQKNGQWVAIQDGFIDQGTYFDFGDAPNHVQFPKVFNQDQKYITVNNEVFYSNPVGGNASQGQLVDKGYVDVDGNPQLVLLYPEAFNGVDVEEHGTFDAVESFYKVKSATSSAIEFVLTATSTSDSQGIDVRANGKSVARIHAPIAKNKNGKDIDVLKEETIVNGDRHIRYSVSGTAQDYPITIDPLQRFCNTTISAPCSQISPVDGDLQKIATTDMAGMNAFTNSSNVNTTNAQQVARFWDGNAGGNTDDMDRISLKFDTGSGGMSSVSSSSLVISTGGATTDCAAFTHKFAPSFYNATNTTGINTTEWQNATTSKGRAGNAIAYTLAAQYATWTLYATTSSAYISATTTTNMYIRSIEDYDIAINAGNKANCGDNIAMNYSETTGVGDDPQLIVDYTAAIVASPPNNNDEQNWFLLLFNWLPKLITTAYASR